MPAYCACHVHTSAAFPFRPALPRRPRRAVQTIDLRPYVNTSPYTLHESASVRQSYELFRLPGLGHRCIGVVPRHDLLEEHIESKHKAHQLGVGPEGPARNDPKEPAQPDAQAAPVRTLRKWGGAAWHVPAN